MVIVCHEDVSGAYWLYRLSHPCMILISGICDWSILFASLSTRGLAPCPSAILDIQIACAWWAIIPCMNSTSALV